MLWSVLMYQGAEAVSGVPSSVRGCHPPDSSAGLGTAGAGRAGEVGHGDAMWEQHAVG